MNVVPALDLRDGACVQLRGGDYDDELLRLDDPASVAARWRDLGFRALHVVDLDAATGRGDNVALRDKLCGLDGVAVQVGGGVRDTATVERLLDSGAASVLVGTRAVGDPDWLAEIAVAFPGRVSLALDVRGGAVTTEGWQHQTTVTPRELLASVAALDLHQVVVTAVDVEGSQLGPDVNLVTNLRAATAHRLAVAGGVANRAHLDTLCDLGVDAVVVGTALYTGALNPEGLTEELHP